jgi:hypothetical protein
MRQSERLMLSARYRVVLEHIVDSFRLYKQAFALRSHASCASASVTNGIADAGCMLV